MKIFAITLVTISAIAQVSFAIGQEGFGPNQKIGTGVGTISVPDFGQARQECEAGISNAAKQAMWSAIVTAKTDCKRFSGTKATKVEIKRLIAQDRRNGSPSFDCVAVAVSNCEAQ